jgi:hypothetical protein
MGRYSTRLSTRDLGVTVGALSHIIEGERNCVICKAILCNWKSTPLAFQP